MATTIEQQVALDEALVPSAQRVSSQYFAELPFEEEILEFLRFLGHSAEIKTLTDVVSRHQNTQQYSAILPIELTTEDIRNTKAYKEYYACATGEAAPKPKASTRRKRGGSASSTTPPTPIATLTPLAALRLTTAAKGKQPARATSPMLGIKCTRHSHCQERVPTGSISSHCQWRVFPQPEEWRSHCQEFALL
nr:hypothetical protein [Tanacetum cinerariifolium]